MNGRLKKNICKLEDYVFLSEVEDLPPRRTAYIGDILDYACHFWADHLTGTSGSSLGIGEICKAIDEFFANCFLFWIEVLSLMGNLGIGVCALNNVRQWYMLVSCV
jgi:hypothetical protein